MNPQISTRINQLSYGLVPEGYHKTAAGIVPTDWKGFRLGEIYTERKEPGNESLPILSVSIHTGVSDGALDEDELGKKVKRIEDKSQYRKALSGDLVFNMMRAWQGAIGVVTSDGMVSPAYIVAMPNDKVYPPFMDDYMKTNRMINTIHSQSYGVTDFRLRLYWDSFAPIYCYLPSVAEQQKIAAILSTQDKLIALKEKRIAEKQKQKKYLMQQLLTGKKRLAGFDGEWTKLPFSDIFTFLPTNTLSREHMTEDNSGVMNIHYGDVLIKYSEVLDVNTTSIPFIVPDSVPLTDAFAASGDVVIADTAEDLTVGKVVELIHVGEKRILSGLHTMFCRPKRGLFAPGWLGYYMNSEAYHNQLIPLICGVKVSSISKKEIVKTFISMPDLVEQERIVAILSVADHEINLLKQDLEQEKKKKKALMQLLLTGIVRTNEMDNH